MADFRQFRACLLLLAEERLGSKRRGAMRAEDDKVAALKAAMTPT